MNMIDLIQWALIGIAIGLGIANMMQLSLLQRQISHLTELVSKQVNRIADLLFKLGGFEAVSDD